MNFFFFGLWHLGMHSKNSRIHGGPPNWVVFFVLRGKQNHPSHPRIRRVKTFLLVSWSRKKMWINVGQISRRGNWPMVTMSPQWPMKNTGFGHLITRLFIMKTSKHVGFGGPWYNIEPRISLDLTETGWHRPSKILLKFPVGCFIG